MTSKGSSVVSISRPSPAARAGLKKGDIIVSCNGHPVRDWVDVLAQSSSGTVSLRIKRGLSFRNLRIPRGPGEELGFNLADSKPRSCGNRCIFCFVDQQPPGLRESLLIKDDDVRYSFLQGTYITLTDSQTAEAVSRGFNTLHVSVHTTDPILRGTMLGRSGPMPVLPNIDILQQHGIDVQAQIVEVPGYNSGKALEQTMADLYSRSNVKILGIVPVGLTGHREGLPPLRRPGRTEALRTLAIVRNLQTLAGRERGFPWVFAADEYYLLAGENIPPADFYRRCTLQANGIGLIAEETDSCMGKVFNGSGVVVTGDLAYPYICQILRNSGYTVISAANRLMGGEVGVAGLLSGADAAAAVIEDDPETKNVFLPSVMFNHLGLTIDGLSTGDISELVNRKVFTVNMIGELP